MVVIHMACSLSTQQSDGSSDVQSTSGNGLPEHSTIPQDVLRLIVALVPSSDHATLRLVSQDMARAVDHTITHLSITRWASKGSIATGFKRLQNVRSISITTKPDWDHVERLTSNMPSLCSLSITDKVNSRMPATCAAGLTALTRLDLGVSSLQVSSIPLPKRGSVQLPALKAASFISKHRKAGTTGSDGTLADIAAFAPNLQQLFCSCLEIQPKETAKLPCCTHFGALELHIVGAISKAAGCTAFTAAFPRLRTFSNMPETIKIHAEQKHFGKWMLAPAELLNLCKSVQAVRGFGPHVARSIGSALTKPAGQLSQLRALSMRAGMVNAANFVSVGQLKALRHLELVFNAPLSRHGPSPSFRASFLRDMQHILQQIKLLPHLQTLALPASILCSACCNEGFSAAAAHADLLHAIEAVVAQKQGLQKVTFLDVQWPEFCSCYAESCWLRPAEHQQCVQGQLDKMRDRQQQRHWLQDVMQGDQNQAAHHHQDEANNYADDDQHALDSSSNNAANTVASSSQDAANNAVNNAADTAGEQLQDKAKSRLGPSWELRWGLVNSFPAVLSSGDRYRTSDGTNSSVADSSGESRQGLWGVYGPADC